jgi:hypothetical protein
MKFGKSEKQPSNTNLLIATIAAVVLVGCGESSPDISTHQDAV